MPPRLERRAGRPDRALISRLRRSLVTRSRLKSEGTVLPRVRDAPGQSQNVQRTVLMMGDVHGSLV